MGIERDYNKLLESLPFWEHLNRHEREWVLSRKAIRKHITGECICGGECACIGLLIVASGSLRTYLLSPEGREITLYRVRPGEVCVMAADCVLYAISFETHVEADEDCELLVIPIDIYAELIKSNIHVERDLYKIAIERFADVIAGVERMVFMNLKQRIAAFLLDESSQRGSDDINLTHEQIAVNIGSARETVSRTLKGMTASGWVELFRGGVRITDKASLYGILG